MKKSIILLLAMVCTITACQVEEMRDVDECSSHHFCIETSFPCIEADNVETKSSIQPRITLKWSDGDLISVVNLTTGKNLSGDLVARVDENRVYFEGDLGGSVRSGDKLAAIYPSQNYTGISNITDISFDLSTQTCSSMNEVPFCAYSLFTCTTVGVVKVESPFIIPVSFNQIAISNIEPNTNINYIELSNVGNNISFNVNKSTGTLDLTSTTGKVRITPDAKQSGDDGSLFAYCALAESNASARSITVRALPNIYTAQWAKSAMGISKYYTSIASDFTITEYKAFMVSEPSSLEVEAEGGVLIFNVSSDNKDWTVSSIPDLDITPSSGSNCENLEVVVNIPKNEGYSEKTYLITFKAADFKYTYSIKQDVLPSNKHIEFPDINLMKYLIANYDFNDDGGISEDEAADIIMVNCSGKGVWDLTGLEACTNLATLNCSNNNITEIELPNLAQLRTVTCNDCPIERMNFDGCSSLQYLNLQGSTTNAISGTSISIDGYTQANTLYFTAKNTPFKSFTFKNTSALTSLELYGEFTDVIVTNNKALTSFVFYAPVLFADISQNSVLESIDVSTLLELNTLYVKDCNLPSLDVTNNLALTALECNGNELTTLDVSKNTSLVRLYCHNNKLSRINVTANTALEKFNISNNLLSVLNIRNNTTLYYLNVSNNTELAMVDVKANTALQILYAEGLAITDLDLSANNALTDVRINNNPNLKTLIIWDKCTYPNNYLRTFKMEGTEVYDKNGNSYGYPYTIGQYIPWFNGGVIFDLSSNNGENGKMVSLTEPEEKLQWCTNTTTYNAKAQDYENGANNMKKIKASSDNWQSGYPAFAWCDKYGTNWYLPAFYELIEIINNQSAINATLSARGYTTLDDGSENGWWPYWTSSQYSTYIDRAHCMDMFDDVDGYYWESRAKKTQATKVRAVFAW